MEQITTTKEQFMAEFTRNLNSLQPTINVLVNAYVAMCNKYEEPHYEMLLKTAGFEQIEGTEEWKLIPQEPNEQPKPKSTKKPRK